MVSPQVTLLDLIDHTFCSVSLMVKPSICNWQTCVQIVHGVPLEIYMKLCSACGETKPKEYFRPDPKMRCGLTSACKQCMHKRCQAWREKNREHVNAENRKAFAKNKDKWRLTRQTWQENNREKCREYTKKYYKNNPEYQLRHITKQYFVWSNIKNPPQEFFDLKLEHIRVLRQLKGVT